MTMTSELILVTATSVVGLILAGQLLQQESESAPEAEAVPIPVRTDEN
ncbi:hypothetical protein PMG71_19745 [Roseofilum sp. BLCC_M154]|uniref:Uncharacterized protein n=1 Tax=Roseofilum acuticapitatum BLCC-M154 TaxID=3022444 RepID=A0ABT7AYZ8_9CYAN|nr:hypothetical protein [Roseofilum acuticapitatum]MDJ1171664.1 hypothetical protein [Roseofilum acuticapitatum BLCC-M154]